MKKKILYLSKNVFPCTSGDAIYSYSILEMLTNIYNVDLVTIIKTNKYEDYSEYKKIKDKVSSIIVLDNPDSCGTFEKISNLATKVLKYGTSYPAYSPEFVKTVIKQVETYKYDAIYFDSIVVFYLYYEIKKRISNHTKIILVQHNYEYRNHVEQLKWGNKSASFKKRIFNLFFKNYEETAIKIADKVISISDEDGDIFKTISKNKEKISVIKPYFDYERVKSEEQLKENNYKLLFLGSMWWYPNINGILWFIENVFNHLVKENNKYKLYIVGANPTKEIIKYSSENIIVTGTVESVDSYIKECDILIVPNRLGGGVKVKIMEGVKKGIPVITIKESSAGYSELFYGDFICNDSKEFVESIKNVIDNYERKKKFVSNGIERIDEILEINRMVLENI